MMPKMYEKLFGLFKRFVNENVIWFAATTDFWTSKTLHSFMSFAIHFITNDWCRKLVVLHCIPFDDVHTAENIGIELKEILFKWDLESKLVTVVTDNAANYVRALENS